MADKGFHGAGRVAFLARKDEIKGMIDAGHPVRNVYRKFEGQLNISYGQFARYVKKLIRGNDDNSTGRNKGRDSASKKKPQVRTRSTGEPAFVSADEPRSKDELV